MTIEEISKNVFPEDKAIVAVEMEVSVRYIDQLLAGDREVKSPRALAVIEGLKVCAEVNMGANAEKSARLVAISEELFEKSTNPAK